MIKFLLATTGDRPALLMACLKSISTYAPSIPVVLTGQSVPDAVKAGVRQWSTDTGHDISYVWGEDRRGPHTAKLSGLQANLDVNVWVSIDDDMELLPQTDYNNAALVCQTRGVGLVSCNWAKSEGHLPKKIKAMAPTFKEQKVVYTGGGLVFSGRVAEVIRGIPSERYVTDNALWSAVVYSRGYKNYRYMGSLALHRIMSKGGRKAYLKESPGAMFPVPHLLTQRKCDQHLYPSAEANTYIPDSKDLTPLAEELHRENRPALL